jgi:hypothetical protein
MHRQAAHDASLAKLEKAYDRLERHTPDSMARALRWLRNPKAKWVRLPLGILLVVAGLLGPLVPGLGIQFIPPGLLLIAQDLPPLREPVAQMTLWLERQWVNLRCRWRRRPT